MSVLRSIRGRRDHSGNPAVADVQDGKASDAAQDPSNSDSDNLSLEARNEKEVQLHPDEVTQNAKLGVQKAEAAALVWSKKAVLMTYAWIWLCFFLLAFQQSILLNVSFKAYASFDNAPALTTAYILAYIIGGVLKLPIARILNIWGRAEGFLIFVGVYVLGMVLIAASKGPNLYATGYVLYWIGYDAIYLILDVFVADTSGLRNRAFTWAFAQTPFIATAFVGPRAAGAFLAHSNWQWAIGTFAIIQPCIFTPLALVFKIYQRKAEKLGLFKHETSGRTALQSVIHYIHEFDVIGGFILTAAFVLFLLPFTLQSYGRAAFDSATFIGMLVVGFVLFFVFAAWENWFARVHFIRYDLLRERTVLGACILAAVLYYSFYAWDNQYFNFVKVVYALDVAEAGYMVQIYNVGSAFWGVVFGVWVRYVKSFKYTCLCFGVPLMILGSGLMIYFRGSDQGIGYIIMSQIFIAFAGGTLVIGENLAVMAAADRDGVPMMLSLIYLAADIGGAIGLAVSTSIYSNTFEKALSSALPKNRQNLVSPLYFGGYTEQEKYLPGTTVRAGINFAWGRVQYYNCISSTAALVLAIPAVAIWKNYRVDKQQNKGTMI